jgi:hypothetical protein
MGSVSRRDQAGYMRDYRAANPDYVKRQRATAKERRQALEVLASRHVQEFEKILTWIRSKRES